MRKFKFIQKIRCKDGRIRKAVIRSRWRKHGI